jgi:NADPH2:quinone reductase
MRALQVTALGDPRTLRPSEIPEPVPGPDQVAIEVHAAGVNFPDALMALGKYQVKPPLPFVLGLEAAGVVRAIGAGVHDVHVGQRVATGMQGGGFAEVALARANAVIPLPDHVSFTTGAGMIVTYGTAYHALVDRAKLAAGERLAVTGAGGGVGTAALDIGRALGARAIGIIGSPEKREAALHAGAVHVLVAGPELRNELVELVEAVDVLLDNVGGEVFDGVLRTMAWRGRILIVGFTSGTIPAIPANRLLLRELEALGVYWGTWSEKHPAQNRANYEAMFELMREGALEPRVHAHYPFEEAGQAVADVFDRRLVGKAVVVVRS